MSNKQKLLTATAITGTIVSASAFTVTIAIMHCFQLCQRVPVGRFKRTRMVKRTTTKERTDPQRLKKCAKRNIICKTATTNDTSTPCECSFHGIWDAKHSFSWQRSQGRKVSVITAYGRKVKQLRFNEG